MGSSSKHVVAPGRNVLHVEKGAGQGQSLTAGTELPPGFVGDIKYLLEVGDIVKVEPKAKAKPKPADKPKATPAASTGSSATKPASSSSSATKPPPKK
jgi:hypothetical protein